MIIVASLIEAPSAYLTYKPAFVVSLVGEDEPTPEFPGLPRDRHLVLYVENESCGAALKRGARGRASALVDFIRNRNGAGDILVHCNRGVSRSTAAAYIVACAIAPEMNEAEILARIRAAAPHADPCPMIVHFADEIMGRDGRMLDALEDLGPPSTAIAAPTVTIPLAA